jgi:lactoylglutathione lyase
MATALVGVDPERGRAYPPTVNGFRDPFPILYATDVERAVRFYVDAFGFEVGYRWPQEGPAEYAFLRLDPLGIGISAYSAPERLHGAAPAEGSPPRFELCVYADDVDRASERLVDLGALELLPPADQPWGERVAYFSDPDGNPIQVTATVR